MARVYYPAVLERGEDGGFGVFFPDLDGCVSSGESASEAARNAEEALALHLEGMAEAGEAIPAPSDVPDRWDDSEVTVAAFLVVGAEEPKVGERVNVWLPKLLLERIDRLAEHRGQSRSTFMKQAAQSALASFERPSEAAPDDTVVFGYGGVRRPNHWPGRSS